MLAKVVNASKAFLEQRNGSVAVMLGVLFPLVTGAAVFAVDHLAVNQQKIALQRAADAAALATVRQVRFVREPNGSSTQGKKQPSEQLSAIAHAIALEHVKPSIQDLKTKAARLDTDAVRVVVSHKPVAPFGMLTGLSRKAIQADATAELFGARNICVIAFEEGSQVGINLENSARIEAGDCGLYSNAKATASVISKDSAYIGADFICSSGGYHGGKGNFSTNVTTDCPPISDPLAERPLPKAPTTCDHTAVYFTEGKHTLEPGHYCGGIIIQDTADVVMNPGIYIISNGKLIVKNDARLFGENVGILMSDGQGDIFFENDADVRLSAPTTGPLAGIVIASRPVCGGTTCHGRQFVIKSAQVRSLLGTIYVPEDRFIIDTTMSISEEAAFTIILARFVQGKQAPTLMLNTDYEATDVPVPDGILGTDGIRLRN